MEVTIAPILVVIATPQAIPNRTVLNLPLALIVTKRVIWLKHVLNFVKHVLIVTKLVMEVIIAQTPVGIVTNRATLNTTVLNWLALIATRRVIRQRNVPTIARIVKNTVIPVRIVRLRMGLLVRQHLMVNSRLVLLRWLLELC